MAEEIVVPIHALEMDIENGQGALKVTIGPMTEKSIRAIAAAAAGGKLKITIG